VCAPLFGCVRLLLAPRYLNISNQRRQGHDLSSIEDSHVLELGEQDFKDLEGLGPALESPPGLSDVSLADSDMHYGEDEDEVEDENNTRFGRFLLRNGNRDHLIPSAFPKQNLKQEEAVEQEGLLEGREEDERRELAMLELQADFEREGAPMLTKPDRNDFSSRSQEDSRRLAM